LNVLDRGLVEQAAAALNTSPGLVEKDWHVVRAIGVLAALDHGDIKPAFSGGTSLSKGWGLIKRFSEDIDFKVSVPAAVSRSKDKERRAAYRDQIVNALTAANFDLEGKVETRDEYRFFKAHFAYPSEFTAARGLRPHLRVEMTLLPSKLPPVDQPIRSLLAELQQHAPEVAAFPCVDPIETAADKLSALAWRVCTRQYGGEKDDPTIIRHLHDLAALESHVGTSAVFATLVQQAGIEDAGRGGGNAPADLSERFAMMLHDLRNRKVWEDEYRQFVQQVTFGRPDELIDFRSALEAARRLVGSVNRDRSGD
jgi:predicted nucleotidyltransferase component of viral defense system